MAEKLGFKKNGEAAFMGGYLKPVRSLPGRAGFRTGISLRASCGGISRFPKAGSPEPLKSGSSKLPKPDSSEDRFILFVSFPYFGRSSKETTLSPEGESVKLLDFKRLGVGFRSRGPEVSREKERDSIGEVSMEGEGGLSVEKGEVLVHQAQYMLFSDSKLYAHTCF